MIRRIDAYRRLETKPGDRDLENGFAARLHDPLWLLARQWQMGEHQGENASSPVRIDVSVARTPIDPLGGNPDWDPQIIPPEALIESEQDDWWTMGRRVAIGDRFKGNAVAEAAAGVRFRDPPPPYDAFDLRLDGRALWRRRHDLLIDDADFGADLPPADTPNAWDSARMTYAARFGSAERPLAITDHCGGPMDWFSADADLGAALQAPQVVTPLSVVPTPLEYPGAPHSRFWEIEDAGVDIGGYPPDTAHFSTMLLVDLIYSHGDDWFLFPVTARAGEIVTVAGMTVTDSFGRTYSTQEQIDGKPRYPGLFAPEDFSMFRCDGLDPAALLVWPVAEAPLESEAVERVQFGTDEQANVLWAVERIVDGREVVRGPAEANPASLPYPAAVPQSDLQAPRGYRYLPATGMETGWHPYRIDWTGDDAAFVLGGLADYTLQHPQPTPRPRAELLQAGTAAAPQLHQIVASAVVPGGIAFERRWQLARDMTGRPVLWMQRQRHILRNVPARPMRFDAIAETFDAP